MKFSILSLDVVVMTASFFAPVSLAVGSNLTGKRRTDVAYAVNSDEVDEEDMLLGSALERALAQLNNANVEAADDGHSSPIVDESTAEQSDNQIRGRFRPRRGRSKIAGT
ncbi:hypothetical protein T11_11384 [Trichinella zimbabwensis]|uniref:Uncharacterized protein n=1 Tax=Trichinella zimbabwensis TaxID=268475 RepID=A0A0V1HRN6_9BILA|nr:hypothetical protein T11_11384 [Trichinella zimbabwensis]